MMGDFQDLPLENLSTLSQEVYLPLICNPENQEGWPEVITKEVTDNFHKFIANSTLSVLPLPSAAPFALFQTPVALPAASRSPLTSR